MKKYFLITPLIVFFCIILVFFYFLIIKRDPSHIPSALIEKKTPKFEAPSLFNEKNFISNKEFGNETVVVNFFSSWCVPCRAEHQYLKILSNEKKIKIIGINYKDDSKEAIKWLSELGNPYSNIAIDLNGHIAIDWGVYGIPESFIINKNNIIQYRQVGPITKKTYKDFYSKIIESLK
tara:strand:+ start:332 stop:865 length:534 start_codon:yes stop_codon:yes gene_type:complete